MQNGLASMKTHILWSTMQVRHYRRCNIAEFTEEPHVLQNDFDCKGSMAHIYGLHHQIAYSLSGKCKSNA